MIAQVLQAQDLQPHIYSLVFHPPDKNMAASASVVYVSREGRAVGGHFLIQDVQFFAYNLMIAPSAPSELGFSRPHLPQQLSDSTPSCHWFNPKLPDSDILSTCIVECLKQQLHAKFTEAAHKAALFDEGWKLNGWPKTSSKEYLYC